MIHHQVTNSRGNFNYNAFVYRDTIWQPHFHGNYELIYVFEGTTKLLANGIPEVLQAGEMILLPPYTVHSLQISGGKTWIGVFSEDFIVSFSKSHRGTRYTKFQCCAEIEDFLQKHLFFQGTPERFLCISCLYMMCSQCIKNAAPYPSEQHQNFVYQVVTYIEDHIQEELSLQDIASSMSYEYHYFSSLFNRAFCMNFKSFINLIRVEQAQHILSDKSISVTQAAERCGFGSIRNFNRVFKNLCNCTPQEYQNQHI